MTTQEMGTALRREPPDTTDAEWVEKLAEKRIDEKVNG
jgi:hypothetical protein